MKVNVKERIIYTTNQVDRKILEVGEQIIDERVFQILKNNKNLEIVKDVEKKDEDNISPKQNIEANVLDNSIEANVLDVEKKDEDGMDNFSKKGKKLKN